MDLLKNGTRDNIEKIIKVSSERTEMLQGITTEEKIYKYKLFWERKSVPRPIIGFDVGGYFPFQRFGVFKRLEKGDLLEPEMLNPSEFLDDYEAYYQQSTIVNDDLIKGVAPISAIPWMELMLGCSAEIGEESIWALPLKARMDELENLTLQDDNAWLKKYLEFLEALVQHAGGRYPVGQPVLRGITDLHGVLRGYAEALIDCMVEPERVKELARRLVDVCIKVFRKQYEVIPPYFDGYFQETYMLWTPGIIIRYQGDATGNFSPKIYKEIFQEYDRLIVEAFPYSLIHLHNSSLFLIDYFLGIEKIDVFQINLDTTGMTMEDELPYLKKVQDKKRCLLLRGTYTLNDLLLIRDNLSPSGLCIQIVRNNNLEAEQFSECLIDLW